MKILFQMLDYGSGADIAIKNYAKKLIKEGNQVKINLYNPKYKFFPLLLRLNRKKEQCDIVYTLAELGWIFKEKNIPLTVIVLHIPEKTEYFNPGILKNIYNNIFLIPQIKKSLKKADNIIAISNYSKKQTMKYTNKYIKVEYPLLDTEKFKPLNITQKDNRFRLLFVGNLIYRKGVDLLPKIMKKLGDKYVLYFTSGLRDKLPPEFNESNMIPLGKISEDRLIEEYNLCDALVFPTRLEGYGYVVVEAMACEKPVVISNCCSLPELITNSKEGFLCEVNNVDEFVNQIIFLKNNKQYAKIMGKKGRETVITKFKL